jgi:hypothetical protein
MKTNMHVRALAGVGAGLLLLAGGAEAQDQGRSPLPPIVGMGSRVRAESPEAGGRIKGLVMAVDDHVLTLRQDTGQMVRLRIEALTALELSLGRKRRAWQGLLIGAGLGLAWGFTEPVDPDTCGPGRFCSRGGALAYGGLGMGFFGAGMGALKKTERWNSVQLSPAPPQASGRRGGGISVSLRF